MERRAEAIIGAGRARRLDIPAPIRTGRRDAALATTRRGGARRGEHAHFGGAGREQRCRCFAQRGAGGDDVVDQQHPTAGDQRRIGGEGAAHVAPPLRGIELALRGGGAHAPQRVGRERPLPGARQRPGQLERVV